MFAGIFLAYLVAFIAAVVALNWLLGLLAHVTVTDSVALVAMLGGMGAIAVLVRHDLGGIVIAVGVMVFWSLLLFGAEGTVLTTTVTVAAAALYAAAAATLIETFLRGRARGA